MKTETRGLPRVGRPARVYAASVFLAILAAAIVVPRVRPSADPLRFVGAEEAAVPADDGDVEHPGPAPAMPGRKVAMLASHISDAPGSASRTSSAPGPDPARVAAIERARREIAASLAKYETIRDYSCVFHKRERIGGALVEPHVMAMKVRTRPSSLYFKFVQPNSGREAIFDPAKNGGKILAHDVGLGRILAGTMVLDPGGSMAMEENRHPVTEAGIGMLIRTVMDRWSAELDPSEAVVEIHPHAKVGHRPCTLIDSTHPNRVDAFLFHRVKLYIDHELGLPIRYEAYDWPKFPGAAPELMEEYIFSDVKTDIGLSDRDFDVSNPHYSFGRF